MTEEKPSSSSLLDEIKTKTESIAKFAQWLVELVRSRNWFTLLLLVDTILLLFGTPGGVVAKFLKDVFSLDLPQWYSAVFWLALGLIFLAALIVALVTMPRQQEAVDFRERKAIKGLRPFGFEDAEIFTRLQRNRNLKECLEALTEPNFRFGILVGKSGCGKTSFLQAGLYPTLAKPESKHRGVYIKFSDRDPLEAIRKDSIEQLQLTEEQLQQLDFLPLLNQAVTAISKPLILFFDQFEQFFVHYKTKEQRDSFIQALATWYNHPNPPAVKILLSIREDLLGESIELQQILGYSLTNENLFRLEKFSPEEATAVLEVIADTEELKCDRNFVRNMMQQELASREDGLISPVDVQVLSWTIERQKTNELRSFDRVAFQKLGGIEGLLTRFLEQTLAARVTSPQRQATVKVLLALTDLERQVRAGVLTIADLQEKLKDSLKPAEVEETTQWLARGDVRLITPIEKDGTVGYELAHERMIPALMGLAGKELSDADRANQLLDRRVNEWLGNQFNNRYLFGWNELRLIEKQKLYIVWGENRRHKERLLAKSKRHFALSLAAISVPLLLVAIYISWWFTPWGQIQQVRWDLVKLSKRVGDENAGEAAVAFAKDGNFAQAMKICQKDISRSSQAPVLSDLAEVYSKFNQHQEVVKGLHQVLNAAKNISHLGYQAEVLSKIAEAYSKQEAVKELHEVFDVAKNISHLYYQGEVLSALAEAYGKLNQPQEVVNGLQQIFDAAKNTLDLSYQASVFSALAEAYGNLNQPQEAVRGLQQVFDAAKNILDSDKQASDLDKQASVLSALASAYGKQEAVKELRKVFDVAKNISDLYYRASVFSALAEAYGNLNQPQEAVNGLKEVLNAVKDILDERYQANVLSEIASAYGKQEAVKELKEVLNTATNTLDLYYRAFVFSEIAEAYGNLNQPQESVNGLKEVLNTATNTLDLSNQIDVLSAIAEAYGKRKAVKELHQVFDTTKNISPLYYQGKVLKALAEAYGKLNQSQEAVNGLQQVLNAAKNISSSSYQGSVFSALASAYGQQEAVKELRKVLEDAKNILKSYDQAQVLSALAKAYGNLKQTQESIDGLQQVFDIAKNISDPLYQANLLEALAEAYGKLNQTQEAVNGLQQILNAAKNVSYSPYQASVLRSIALNQAKLDQWGQARQTVELITIEDTKVESLARILTIWAEKQNPALVEKEEIL